MEIEKKFRVNYYPKEVMTCPVKRIKQSYLSITPEVRLRSVNDEFYLTIKGEGTILRTENEMKIIEETFLDLISRTIGTTIIKNRFIIKLDDGNTAELDVYENPVSAVSVVEVEFLSAVDADKFIPPDWFGDEVTQEERYKNKNIAMRHF